MKPEQEHLQPLLDEVVPDEARGIGPDCAQVLALVRAERVRRTQRRATLSVVCVLGLLAGFLLTNSQPKPETPPVVTMAKVPQSPPAPAPFKLEVISDAELLALLQKQGTPSALLEWPDGKRTLLIVEHP